MVVFMGRNLSSLLAFFKKKGAAKGEGEKRLSVQYTAGEECPDNVFFPSTRPPHLEELHSQAQQGLKSLQHQEKQKQTKSAWDHGDTSSLQSCASSEDDSLSFRTQAASSATDSTSEDALSIRSEMIQRKGSTFRPHDSFPKSSERAGKKRKERRTTVLGIPQHVHKELGLRNSHGAKGHPEVAGRGPVGHGDGPAGQPLLNGGQVSGDAVRIPTIDGKLQPLPGAGGARVCLGVLEEADAALQKHINRVYYDDSLVGRKTAAKLSPMVRPKSLAVPGMTTYANPPEILVGPVMSISPQGTYMSKIIPNAILPPMVDVVALTSSSPFSPTGEDEVFSPSLSETSSLRSESLAGASSPEAPRGRPGVMVVLREPQAQAKWSCPDGSERTMSPSSGYSSQSGTPTLPAKGLGPPAVSPGKSQPQKPDRVCSLQSPALSVSSSLTSISSSASDPTPPEALSGRSDRFIIPPHPKVPAPFSPPPTKPQQPPASAGPLQPSPTPPAPSTAGQEPSAKPNGKSPPPSPPPAYHPPPPPAKKVEGSPQTSSETPADTTWPPPPPPAPEEHELSMADFPPPDESYLSSLPDATSATVDGQTATTSPGAASSSSQQQEPPAGVPQPPRHAEPLPMASVPPPPPPLPPPSAPALPPQISLKKAANGPRVEAKKEPVSRSKSGPVAKEDASLPIVTPSLLQMVRLRSVSVEPAAGAGPEERLAPQKPVRRSLSTRQPPPAQDAVPSKQLHHAVHLKAAALAAGEAAEKPPGGRAAQPGAEGLPGDGQLSPRNKSPASTASFIFAKSSRRLVIETASSPEAQADLKRNLVAELMNVSGQRSAAPAAAAAATQGPGKAQAQRKPGKIPPPVAKKPSLGSGPAPSPKAPGAEALGSPVLDGDAKVEESRTKSELVGTEGRNGAEPPAQSLPAQDRRGETA
ncbi:Uncharacterized protein KIAA1522 [Lonchura striata]|uniref:Uncharacterized protein KIAA1522 n=1 Tax=Lonchura striata TaxID=40157 RepID=A0A218UGS1_9PASE|nr:Uncharacterized protein KIAA1522 [Lonchura striata domestica]